MFPFFQSETSYFPTNVFNDPILLSAILMLLLSYCHSILANKQINNTITLFNLLETGKGEPGKNNPRSARMDHVIK